MNVFDSERIEKNEIYILFQAFYISTRALTINRMIPVVLL